MSEVDEAISGVVDAIIKEIHGDVGVFTQLQREQKIKKELSRLKKILAELNPDAVRIMQGLIRDAAFMAVTLEETRLIIVRDGIIEAYQNGANQSGRKKSSAVEVYDKMVNTYSKVIKQICDELPRGNR